MHQARHRWREIAQVAEAAVALSVASLAIAILPFRWIVRSMGSSTADNMRCAADVQAVRIAVRRASRRLPWRIVCFQEALAVHWMLRVRGNPSRLHYGLKQADGRLTAHVWVTLAGAAVIGEEAYEGHVCVAVFPTGRANG